MEHICFICPDLPVGWSTVLGHMARTNPEALSLVSDPLQVLREDEAVLNKMARERSIPVGSTTPPLALAGRVETVRYYPTELIEEALTIPV